MYRCIDADKVDRQQRREGREVVKFRKGDVVTWDSNYPFSDAVVIAIVEAYYPCPKCPQKGWHILQTSMRDYEPYRQTYPLKRIGRL